MNKHTQDVKSKSRVVGVAEYSIYDSVSEATDSLGEATCLSVINAQVRTNAMNAIRATAVGKPSKAAQLSKAMASITIEEFQEVAGDQARMDNLLEEKIKIIQEAELAAATTDVDEDEGLGVEED